MRRLLALVAGAGLIAAFAYSQAETPLRWLGHYLVLSEAPEKSDVIFVLAGDFQGQRVRKGCELAQQGFAPKVWVSGPDGVYGHTEADLAVAFAIRHGCPAHLLEAFYSRANSTLDETKLVRERAAAAGYRSLLVVTSNFHTRRSARLFRREIPGMRIRVVGAPDAGFDPDSWWKSRPMRKTFAFEWIKTVTSWVGI